jgi:hypothetical protein
MSIIGLEVTILGVISGQEPGQVQEFHLLSQWQQPLSIWSLV